MAQKIVIIPPSYEEQQAIMAHARRLQAEAMADMFRAIGRGLRRFVASNRPATAH